MNYGTGASLRNWNAITPMAVTITNGNFNYNTQTGLEVKSKGAIALKNVNAFENNETSIFMSQTDHRVPAK